MVVKHCDAKDLFDYRETFEIFDVTGKGFITYEEWMKTLRSQCYKKEEAEDLYYTIGQDKSNIMEYHEFLAATMQYKKDIAQTKLVEAFCNIDHDNDGKITGEDLANVFDLTIKKAKELLREVHNCDEIEEPCSKYRWNVGVLAFWFSCLMTISLTHSGPLFRLLNAIINSYTASFHQFVYRDHSLVWKNVDSERLVAFGAWTQPYL